MKYKWPVSGSAAVTLVNQARAFIVSQTVKTTLR